MSEVNRMKYENKAFRFARSNAYQLQATKFIIAFINASFLSIAFFCFMKILSPQNIAGNFWVCTILWFIFLFLFKPKKTSPLKKESVQTLLDIKSSGSADEKDAYKKLKQDLGIASRRSFFNHASSAVVPFALAVFGVMYAQPNLSAVVNNVKDVVASFKQGVTMKIIEGGSDTQLGQELQLSSSSPAEITLLEENLIEIKMIASHSVKSPIVELRNPDNPEDLLQSFQLVPEKIETDSMLNRFAISLNIENSSLIVIPIESAKPLAKITVKESPIPKVSLSAAEKLEEPWPDNIPIPLVITANGEQPLATINLIVVEGKKTSRELVNSILATDKKDFSTTYELLVEPYLENDISEIQIIAEAIDRSLPKPLIGYSDPITLQVASAYGRYRSTLQTLRNIKTSFDDTISNDDKKMPETASEDINKAIKQSLDSPFFDGLDRVQLSNFQQQIKQLSKKFDSDNLTELSNDLNYFLFEHEMIDNRQRDRDFFVSARGLSRILEKTRDKRTTDVNLVVDRMKEFLDERNALWAKRLEYVGKEFHPKNATEVIQQRPFRKKMQQIQDYEASLPENSDQSLRYLSEIVGEYRMWIEALEEAEDKSREKREKEQQQNMTNSQNVLKKIRKRQSGISTDLDKAATKDQQKMQADWMMTRMEQNQNVKDTEKLARMMRSLSPLAAKRIEAAKEQMEGTVSKGNEKQFALAESHSDLAGRLLIQAQNAAQREQQRRRRSGRKRKRVTGDNYFGQTILPADIEIIRNYKVDERYREVIINDIIESDVSEEDARYLREYLKEVVR